MKVYKTKLPKANENLLHKRSFIACISELGTRHGQMTTPAEYIVKDILDHLGGLVNKAQEIRNNIPVDMLVGDARHVCLSGIQTSLEPVMLAFGAIECTNQCIPDIDLTRVSGIKKRTNKEQLDNFDTWAKLTILVFTHFRLESMFLNLLSSIDPTQADTRGFELITTKLFDRITVTEKDEKKDCLKVMTVMRNSLHNNSVNKNASIDKTIKGKRFELIKNQNTHSTIFDIIFFIDCSLDIIEEVINAPEVLRLPTPIPDQFHLNLSGA